MYLRNLAGLVKCKIWRSAIEMKMAEDMVMSVIHGDCTRDDWHCKWPVATSRSGQRLAQTSRQTGLGPQSRLIYIPSHWAPRGNMVASRVLSLMQAVPPASHLRVGRLLLDTLLLLRPFVRLQQALAVFGGESPLEEQEPREKGDEAYDNESAYDNSICCSSQQLFLFANLKETFKRVTLYKTKMFLKLFMEILHGMNGEINRAEEKCQSWTNPVADAFR